MLGNNINIRTDRDANFEGTQIEATDSATLDAGGDINFTAAANTSSYSEDESSVSVSAAGGSSGEFEAEVGVGVASASGESSEAVIGGINAGNLTLRSGGDANFEGTEVNVEDQATLDVGGDLNVTAARNTASDRSDSVEVEVGVEVGDDVSAEVGVAVESERSESSEAIAGAFNVGSLDLTVEGDANLEGTEIAIEEDGTIDIGGDLNFTAARSTESSSSTSVSVDVGIGGGTEDDEDEGSSTSSSSFELGVGVGVAEMDSNQAAAGFLGAGGNLSLTTGGDATFEGTEIEAGDGVEIDAGGDVAFNEALSTYSNTEVNVGIGFGRESETTTEENGDFESEAETSGSLEL